MFGFCESIECNHIGIAIDLVVLIAIFFHSSLEKSLFQDDNYEFGGSVRMKRKDSKIHVFRFQLSVWMCSAKHDKKLWIFFGKYLILWQQTIYS